jgi:hypothetical protein
MPRKPKPGMFEKEERMKKVIAAVKAKQFRSVEAAAEHFDVPPSTLGHRLSGRVKHPRTKIPIPTVPNWKPSQRRH